jgi:hypothetical protein
VAPPKGSDPVKGKAKTAKKAKKAKKTKKR